MKIIDKVTKERSKLTAEEWKEFTKTVWSIANTTHDEHPAVFPPEIPLRLIKLFSFWGETVLDPFGGSGTTAEVGVSLGRRVVSVDQNAKYSAIARKRSAAAKKKGGKGEASILTGDSRSLASLKAGSVSLVVTSPPYWDKADYGGSASDIGRRSNYGKFIEDMRDVFAECFRVLEPGRKICVNTANVNQYTEYGLLTFPIAADFCMILRDLGFVMVNELIWSKDKTGGKWGSANGQRPIFGSYPFPPNFLFKNVHEYILVFAKPDTLKKKGAKVRLYSELMGNNVLNESPPSGATGLRRKGHKSLGRRKS